MPINIAIVDDHDLILDGLTLLLQSHADLNIQSKHNNAHSLLKSLEQQQPDILLLDIQLKGMQGNELVRVIHKNYPGIKMIALTSMESLFYVNEMMQYGCLGYLTKLASRDVLPEAIRTVYEGKEYLEPALKQRWEQRRLQSTRQKAKVAPLSNREQEILELIAAELTTQEIADKLFISLRTVESHRYSLLQKLDVKNTAGLIKNAVKLGFIE